MNDKQLLEFIQSLQSELNAKIQGGQFEFDIGDKISLYLKAVI